MKILVYFIAILPFFACTSKYTEKEVYGKYSPQNYNNNYDTIQLCPNRLYNRIVYDRTKKLILLTKGEWRIDNNSKIKLSNFYLNLDTDFIKFPESSRESMEMEVVVEKVDGLLRFCVGHYQGENCYIKNVQ
jgi:hypothetical protein